MQTGWGEGGDAAALLEALYRIDVDEGDWLDGLWRGLHGMVPDADLVIASRTLWVPGEAAVEMSSSRGSNPAMVAYLQSTSGNAESHFIAQLLEGSRRFCTMLELYGDRLGSMAVADPMKRFDAGDGLVLHAPHPSHVGDDIVLGAVRKDPIELTVVGRRIWDRIGSHLAAATRLRLGRLTATEGVLSPDGDVVHAEGDARSVDARDALKRAAVAIHRARRGDARRDPGALLDARRANVERRWTLVDTVESDGRRYMLARVNPPEQVAHPEMTPREREVAALVGCGVPQKAIAYELDLSTSTVAFHVRNIARKLGASSSVELTRVLAAQLVEGRQRAAAASGRVP
jgi:DNA-binding CsgD family transcriptional regulator